LVKNRSFVSSIKPLNTIRSGYDSEVTARMASPCAPPVKLTATLPFAFKPDRIMYDVKKTNNERGEYIYGKKKEGQNSFHQGKIETLMFFFL
jgi:hypothetical protein